MVHCVHKKWCPGGNQRELARQKNLKKQQDHTKGKKADDKDGNKGTNLQERRQRYVAKEKLLHFCTIQHDSQDDVITIIIISNE